MRAYLIILLISFSWSMSDGSRFSKKVEYEYSAYIDLLNIKIARLRYQLKNLITLKVEMSTI